MQSESLSLTNAAYRDLGPQEALCQVAKLIENAAHLHILIAPNRESFKSEEEGSYVLSAAGRLVDHSLIVVDLALLRVAAQGQGNLVDMWAAVSSFGDKIHVLPPDCDGDTDYHILGVCLKIKASPMGPVRLDALNSELLKLAKLVETLRSQLPSPLSDTDLVSIYETVEEYLGPIFPLQQPVDGDMLDWANETAGYLHGGSSVALDAATGVIKDYVLSLLAMVVRAGGNSLGWVKEHVLSTVRLLELARKAPGTIVVSASQLNMGINRYDRENEVQSLLDMVTVLGCPVVFTGSGAHVHFALTMNSISSSSL